MASGTLDQLIGGSFDRDGQKIIDATGYVRDLTQAVKDFAAANSATKQAEGLMGQATTIKQTADASKVLQATQRALGASYQELDNFIAHFNGTSEKAARVLIDLNRARREEIALETEIQSRKRATAEARKADAAASTAELRAEQTRQKISAKGTQEQVGQYDQLRKAYNEAAKAAKEIGVAEGINSAKFKQAAADAKKMYDTLYAVESAVGQNQRGVGQYERGTAGLSNAVQQILREAPSAANSLNTFFLAISNNLPILFDEIGRVNVRLGELKSKAEAANVQLTAQTSIQQGAATAAKEAEETLSAQVEGIIASVGASKEQAAALRENIASTVQGAAATGENTAVTVANTEQLAINAGATAEEAAALRVQAEATALATQASIRQTAALEAQTVATAEANAIATKAPGVLKGIVGSILSLNTGLTLGVLALTLWGGKISEAVTELFKGKDAVDKMKASTEQLSKAFTSSEYTEAVANVRELASSIKLASDGLLDKDKVLHLYNETIGKTTGEVKSLEEAEKALGKNADAYVKMTLYKAAAAASQKEAVDEVLKAERAQLEGEQNLAAARKSAQQDSARGIKDGLGEFVERGISGSNDATKRAAETRIKTLDEVTKRLREKAAQIAKANNFDFFGGTEDEKEQKQKRTPRKADFTNEQLKAETDLTAALYEQLKQRSANSAAEQKAIAEDETNNLQKRADAYERYTFEQLNIAGFESAKEQDIIRQKLAKIAEIEGKSVGARTNEEKKLALSKNALEVQLVTATEKYESVRTGIIEENTKQQAALIKAYGKDAEEAIKQAQKNLQGISIDGPTDSNEKRDARFSKGSKYTQQSIDLAHSLADLNAAVSAQRLQQIDDEINKIKERGDAEIAQYQTSAAYSIASEQERNEKINGIKAEAAAQEKRLEDERISRQRRAAIFEKGVTIASIIANTSLAVIKALQGPPVYKFVEAAIVAATGAAQLAAAIASPLPSYFLGSDGKYVTGKALTDEGGRELYIQKDGKAYLGSDQPNIKHFSVPTQIVPKDITDQLLKRSLLYTMGFAQIIPEGKQNAVEMGEVVASIKDLKRAVQSAPQTAVSITGNGITHLVQTGSGSIRRMHNLKG